MDIDTFHIMHIQKSKSWGQRRNLIYLILKITLNLFRKEKHFISIHFCCQMFNCQLVYYLINTQNPSLKTSKRIIIGIEIIGKFFAKLPILSQSLVLKTKYNHEINETCFFYKSRRQVNQL